MRRYLALLLIFLAGALWAQSEQVKPEVTILELGSEKCVPCLQMRKVLAQVEEKWGGRVAIKVYDVWKEDKDQAVKWNISLIPTQIFLDASGRQFHRHEGYYPIEEIDALLSARLGGEATLSAGKEAPKTPLASLFNVLGEALSSKLWIAVLAAFLWGICSVVLSPCHLASIPLIVGFIGGQANLTVKRAFQYSLVFGMGILITITIIGVLTALAGRMLGDFGKWGNVAAAALLFFIGILFLDIIPMSAMNFTRLVSKRRGLWTALLIGFILGVGLGPCTFAFMAPMLGVLFFSGAQNLSGAVVLLVVFAIGHIGVIVLAGTFTEVVQRYLNWNDSSRFTSIVRRLCGILILAAAFYNVSYFF